MSIEHGTRRGFLDGCECSPCLRANARYCKQWRHRAKGGSVNVDATPIREHINALPMSQSAVAEAAGLSRTTIRHIANGHTKRTMPKIAAAILAVRGDADVGSRHVSSLGATRRLQALAAIGWSGDAISQRTGYSVGNLFIVREGKRDTITSTVDQRIRAAFDELWASQPPTDTRVQRSGVTRTKREAAQRGYLPPMAWDDIDDPDETPAIGSDGTNWPAIELVAEHDYLTAAGESEEQAARQLGVTLGSVEKARLRLERKAA